MDISTRKVFLFPFNLDDPSHVIVNYKLKVWTAVDYESYTHKFLRFPG